MIHCNYTIKYKFFIDFMCTHTYPCLPLHRPTCYLIGSPQCNQCALMLKSDRIHFAESLDMRELDTIPFGGQRLCEVFWWHTFSAAFPDGILSSLTSKRIHARPTQDVCQMRARRVPDACQSRLLCGLLVRHTRMSYFESYSSGHMEDDYSTLSNECQFSWSFS